MKPNYHLWFLGTIFWLNKNNDLTNSKDASDEKIRAWGYFSGLLSTILSFSNS